MKVLSLEEIKSLQEIWEAMNESKLFGGFDLDQRILHTAREYHRLRKALEFYANPDHIEDDSDVEEIIMDQGDFDEHEFRLGKIAREALKESEEVRNEK